MILREAHRSTKIVLVTVRHPAIDSNIEIQVTRNACADSVSLDGRVEGILLLK